MKTDLQTALMDIKLRGLRFTARTEDDGSTLLQLSGCTYRYDRDGAFVNALFITLEG